MERFPSIGLAELAVLAVVAGLVLLAGITVVAVVVLLRRSGRARAAESVAVPEPVPSSPRRWLWIVLIVLVVVAAVPLCIAAGGVLLVMPVERSVGQQEMQPEVHVVQVGESIGAASPAPTVSGGEQIGGDPSLEGTRPAATQTREPGPVALNPVSPAAFVAMFGLAGLTVLLGVVAVTLIGRIRAGADEPPGYVPVNGDSRQPWYRTAKVRHLLVAIFVWIALSVFLVLDLAFQVSLYWQFVVMYTAFCVLVGGLLLAGSSMRAKLLSLGLLVLFLFSVRMVDWNTRKSFLKDFGSLEEGMTPAQVDRTMSGYMKEYSDGTSGAEPSFDQGQIVTGLVVYHHTQEGWGDSDVGIVTYENGRVAHKQFLPD